MDRNIVGAAIGECVHVAGLINFLRLAEEQGYQTTFLGPAVSIPELIGAVTEAEPDIVAVSYRLSPETADVLLDLLRGSIVEAGLEHLQWIFGGTPPVARLARQKGFFSAVFDGTESLSQIIAFLRGEEQAAESTTYPQQLLERIEWKKPYPLLRHHFGLPDLERTIRGVGRIAQAGVLDVVSLGPDQVAQEFFFRPEEAESRPAGAGGVPVRSPEDLRRIYEASRTGNYPLMRCYSGTQDVLKWAEVLVETINNAWCAVPLFWYNELDRRGPRPLRRSLIDAQRLMRWHGERGIPVECNEAHHWSLRDAHDTIAVVAAYLGAYNARAMGVRCYVAQYMLNTPPGTTARMDLAKMLAKKQLISDLEGPDFRVLTQVRAGLASFPTDLAKAKGQLGYSTYVGMALRPDIVHVVGFSEADHAATVDDVIESCLLAERIIENAVIDYPDLLADPFVQCRRDELMAEAAVLLQAISALGQKLGASDSFTDVDTLVRAVELGLLDAPHLRNTPPALGRLKTRIVNGACVCVDPDSGEVMSEKERLERLLAQRG